MTDLPIGDIASVTSTVIAGASLVLQEAGRESDRERRANSVHAALLVLHDRMHEWLGAAVLTNDLARDWRRGLPDSAGHAADMLAFAMVANKGGHREVARALRTPVDIQTRRRRDWLQVRAREPRLTLSSLLHVHAAEAAFDVDAALKSRGEILRTLPEELERRYADGGLRAVDAFVSEMDDTVQTLDESSRQLATFISERFPLGTV